MPTCEQCGAEHELLDPMFRRPDAYLELEEDQQEAHARADDDLCRIDLPTAPAEMFVRCVLPVRVQDVPDGISWGLWVAVDETAFARILERWNDVDQASEPPLPAIIANAIPGYETRGLPAHIQLTGPETRPNIVLGRETDEHADNLFVKQCREGVDQHLAHRWAHEMSTGQRDNPLDAPNLRAFVCGHVADGETVRYAVRDGDGDWQFLCGGEHGGATDQPAVLDVSELLERDASLRELGSLLQSNQQAERKDGQAAWRKLT